MIKFCFELAGSANAVRIVWIGVGRVSYILRQIAERSVANITLDERQGCGLFWVAHGSFR